MHFSWKRDSLLDRFPSGVENLPTISYIGDHGRRMEPRLVWQSTPKTSAGPVGRLSPEARTERPQLRAVFGENRDVLRCLAEEPGTRGEVMLAYLDPPFWTGRQHRVLERGKAEGEVAFDDRWGSLSEYLEHLHERAVLVRELLHPAGSLVVHVDPKTSHYVKLVLDQIFGRDAFASEVVWRYRRWPSKTKNFQRVHDVMLRYVKDPSVEPRFQQLYEPLAPSTQKTWGDQKQRAIVGDEGRRLRSSKTEVTSPGTPLGDVWEIGIIAPVARERTGYPTQKPLALLRRWIEACTFPGDLVLDPYAGSGTTLVAAAELGRRAIGVDQGLAARDVLRERLAAAKLECFEQTFGPRLRSAGSRVIALGRTG
jgi:DNA modification methylase